MARVIERETLRAWMRRGTDFDRVSTLPRAAHERHHLPAAIHITCDDIETGTPRRLPDRGRTVVVYWGSTACRQALGQGPARLDALGYRDVREYAEGRQHWEAAALPVESGPDPQGDA